MSNLVLPRSVFFLFFLLLMCPAAEADGGAAGGGVRRQAEGAAWQKGAGVQTAEHPGTGNLPPLSLFAFLEVVLSGRRIFWSGGALEFREVWQALKET